MMFGKLLIQVRIWFRVLNTIPCSKCGSRTVVTRNESYLPVLDNGSGPVLEYEEACAECGANVNYWAYGSYQYPTTYTELITFKWYSLKSKFTRRKA
mgnify:CR=1 FL=1